MTAPALVSSLDSGTIESCFESSCFESSFFESSFESSGYRPRLPIASRTHRPQRKPTVEKLSSATTRTTRPELPELNLVWKSLLEALPQGVIIISRTLQPLYWNQKAKTLCQALGPNHTADQALPRPVSEACYGVMRNQQALQSALIVECRTTTGHSVRVRAQLLNLVGISETLAQPYTTLQDSAPLGHPSFIVVFLENCDEVMQQERRIQQQKYDFTDREAEIWMLLRQELTYQEIAQALQISLNTVKTHVKNVYAKRRSCQGKEKFWC
ncbi:MAG: LuxR C-terminal-related transcriptional regulator [Leptolyngbyaceae cyanobacterium bins.349]|nr:LuxR C-terminal-related transcriptional regulator [Leptolyngbyaceae cyanobacterium bins.349]